MTAKHGVSLMGCLSEIDDPRKPSNGTLHDFREILVIAIAATLSDSDTVEDIAFLGAHKGNLAASVSCAQEWNSLRGNLPAHLPGHRPEAV